MKLSKRSHFPVASSSTAWSKPLAGKRHKIVSQVEDGSTDVPLVEDGPTAGGLGLHCPTQAKNQAGSEDPPPSGGLDLEPCQALRQPMLNLFHHRVAAVVLITSCTKKVLAM